MTCSLCKGSPCGVKLANSSPHRPGALGHFNIGPQALLRQARRIDSPHVPLSLAPSFHRSLPRYPTPLFQISLDTPHFPLCQVRDSSSPKLPTVASSTPGHVHSSSIVIRHKRRTFCLTRLFNVVLYASVPIISFMILTGFCRISARYLLPRVYHMYVFVNALSPRTKLRFLPTPMTSLRLSDFNDFDLN